MSLVQQVKSPKLRMFLQEARALWSLGKHTAAADRAAKVLEVEGRAVFAASDAALLAATLARIAEKKALRKKP